MLENLGELEILASWQLVDVKVCVTNVEDHRVFKRQHHSKTKSLY